ncbi:MAG: hypothetical protein IGS39_01390 [Calothrix sp. C42_A2020_038]|nr:hypothetical protein [Calothrix sp. C42_A2020_038]
MPNEFDDMETNPSPIELSQEELDGISGGISIFVSGSMFERRDVFAQQRKGSRRRGSSVFASSHIFSSAFQIIGLGLNSPGDVMNFFRGIFGFFGRR